MNEPLTIEQLRKSPAYLVLSDQQRLLCEAFLVTGNKLESVKRAYNCTSRASSRVMASMMFSKPKILACLAAANGGDAELARFDAELTKAIKNPRTTRTQISGLRLMAQARGYLVTAPMSAKSDDEPQTFRVGDIVIQEGKRYKIVAEEME